MCLQPTFRSLSPEIFFCKGAWPSLLVSVVRLLSLLHRIRLDLYLTTICEYLLEPVSFPGTKPNRRKKKEFNAILYLSLGSVTQTDRKALDVMTGSSTSQVPGKTLERALCGCIPGRLHGLVQCIDLERASLISTKIIVRLYQSFARFLTSCLPARSASSS